MDGQVAQVVASVVGATTVVIGALVGLGWWLSDQFRKQSSELNKSIYGIRDKLVEKMGEVEDKLEIQIRAHEKLDDERFNALNLTLIKNELRGGSGL